MTVKLSDTTRVNISSAGTQGNSYSRYSSISADGRFVAFHSYSNNLVPDDSNGVCDVFVHDRHTGETTRVSVSSSGVQGNDHSFSDHLAISSNGRFIAFVSHADNLVADDLNGERDIFVHDRQTNETTRVSVSSAGFQSNSDNSYPTISADGRFVAFHSLADNLIEGDTNSSGDIFVHDRQTAETKRVSVSSGFIEGDRYSMSPSISANGESVAFSSAARNLTDVDTNNSADIFVHDRGLQFSLTLFLDPQTEGGVVTVSPNEVCETSCVYNYAPGTSIELTARANDGWIFEYWELGGIARNFNNPATIVIDNDKMLTAKFSEGDIFETDFSFGIHNYKFDNDTSLVDIALYNEIKSELFGVIPATPDAIKETLLNAIWSLNGIPGYCWGMSASSATFKVFEELKPIPKPLHDYEIAEALDAITGFHESHALTTLTSFISILRESYFFSENQKDDFDKIKENILEGSPVVVDMSVSDGIGGHAVVAYKIIETDNYAYVYVYDPNHSDWKDGRIIFDKKDQGNYVPSYSKYNLFHAWEPWQTAASILPYLKNILSDVIKELFISLYGNARGFFRLSCPADALLIDEEGRRIGMLNGELINEVPSAKILSTGEVEIYELPFDRSYSAQITATASGLAEISTIIPEIGLNQIKNTVFHNAPLSTGCKITLNFNTNNTGDLSIDLDNDGVVDTVQSPSMEESINIDFEDGDSDGVVDIIDNCPYTNNPNQNDSDGNGVGDVCESICVADFAPTDGDVDGADLADYISDAVGVSLNDFAGEFGRIDCF